MDYDKFTGEYKMFQEWNSDDMFDEMYIDFKNKPQVPDCVVFGKPKTPVDDRVNSPSHYTAGRTEAIDVIEDAIKDAVSVESGMLQAQVLKYLLRLWLKDNPVEDAKKARWYLNRLIDKLS